VLKEILIILAQVGEDKATGHHAFVTRQHLCLQLSCCSRIRSFIFMFTRQASGRSREPVYGYCLSLNETFA
jgi:hypothetical protein